ncbi:hypothetical protein Vi05172_g2040 [Venturia inaequalis]|uniref:Zn(2)-C6 fungal-type domain-containing protein n=1 Tax=Venturia inaequalis TaxID=5025 RepID=A0A8H3VUR6_VENIN|nr:hypothetical protein EG327_005865 [Venturia inaequalis]RDI88046.1 hypothetical protein Vi05172_g2040 [Venturia inaequalis]
MSKHSLRSSSRLQPIAPGRLPGPALVGGGQARLSAGMGIEMDVGVASKTALKPSAKRQAVISVACRNCQKQKSKCDGFRPMCGPCGKRGRRDCSYELPRDQRRSTFMRERIGELSRETSELKDIIRGICLAEDREAAVEAARMLVNTGFENTQEVAQLLRSSETLPSFATPGFRRSRGDLVLQSLQDRTSSMPLPHDLSLSHSAFQLPFSYPPAMPQQEYMPFQMANGNYVPHAAPSSSSQGGYWTSSMNSPFSTQDLEFSGWPPAQPEG